MRIGNVVWSLQTSDDADWRYIDVRAMPDGPEQDQAFLDEHRRWPDNVWLSNAAGYVYAKRGDWNQSARLF